MNKIDYISIIINLILLLFLLAIQYNNFAQFINGVTLFLVGLNFGWFLCKRVMCKHWAEIVRLVFVEIEQKRIRTKLN